MNQTDEILIRQKAEFALPWISTGMKILDLGCGNGLFAKKLVEMVNDIDVIAVYESKDMTNDFSDTANVRYFYDVDDYLSQIPDNIDLVIAYDYFLRKKNVQEQLSILYEKMTSGGVIAVKEGLMGTDYYRQFPVKHRFESLHALLYQLHKAAGDHPNIGAELRGMLNKAGYLDPAIRVETQTYQAKAQLEMLKHWYLDRFNDRFAELAVEKGYVTQQECERLLESFYSLPDDPAAIVVLSWITLIAKKH